jgi:hypothetical protein
MAFESSQRYKVVQWATGQVGMPALRGIIEHPELELVGVFVTSEPKDGRDAGELCGISPVGVAATSDFDALVALDADCVCYSATDVGRVEAVYDDLVRLLASGKNVVNNAITKLVHPNHVEPAIIERLEAACREGGSTLYNTGIHPGVVSDQLLFAASNLSQRIDRISAAEHLDCSCYDALVIGALGFGKALEDDAEQFDDAILYYYWGDIVRSFAEWFELELDEVRHFRRPSVTNLEFTTPMGLEIRPGTIGAIHYGIEGVVDGEVRFVAENYEWVRADTRPSDWPEPPGRGGYRLLIDGVPNMRIDVAFNVQDPLPDGVLIGTGMRAVNSIPAVCQAPTGVVRSFAQLPHVRGFMTR